MEWALPTDVEKVECHLTWLRQILNEHGEAQEIKRFVYTQKLRRENTNESSSQAHDNDDDAHAAAAVNNDEEDYVPNDENVANLHPQISNYAVVLSMELVRSCKAAFLGKYEESGKHLERTQEAFGCLTGDHKRLLRVFQYCVTTLKWCIDKLEQQDVNEVVNDDVQIATFRKEWEEFQCNDRDRAAIAYLKGRLENNLLAYDDNRKIELRTKMLDLDPDYYIWWTIGYQEMRRSRRHYKRPQDKMKAPCKDEIDYCNKAYDGSPDTLLCVYNKATMLKDVIFVKQDVSSFIFSEPRSPIYEMGESELKTMCLENLHKAERLAAEHGLPQRSMQIFLQKVDLLIKDKNCDNRKKGLRLLEESIQDDSNNAHMCFKLGKIYQYGLGPEKVFKKDVNKARLYYEQALQGDMSICTFAWIKSYLKLLPHLPNPLPVEETLQLLGLHYSSLKTDFQRGTVTMWKGFLQWVLGITQDSEGSYKRLACMVWLDVLGLYTEKQKELLESLQNILSDFSRSVGKQQFIVEVKAELTTIREEASRGLQPEGYVTVVDRFLGELQIWQESIVRSEQQNRQRGGGRGQTSRQPARHVQRGSGRNRTFQPGMADQSDNWRLN